MMATRSCERESDNEQCLGSGRGSEYAYGVPCPLIFLACPRRHLVLASDEGRRVCANAPEGFVAEAD
jgi:hypothetical protein